MILGLLACGVAQASIKESPKVPLVKDIKDAGELKEGPFKGIEPAKLSQAAASLIFSANYDFVQVLERKEPLYAVKDGGAFLDGGTQVYKGVGYKLIRHCSLTEIAGVKGLTLGVTIIFDNKDEFSQTRFVSRERSG